MELDCLTKSLVYWTASSADACTDSVTRERWLTPSFVEKTALTHWHMLDRSRSFADRIINSLATCSFDRSCGLVVRLPDCSPRVPEGDFRRCQIFWVAVSLEQCPLSPCEYKWGATLKEKYRLRSRKLRSTTLWDPPRWPRDTPLSAKVGTKIRRQVPVAQLV
jgi:hypothetical protein